MIPPATAPGPAVNPANSVTTNSSARAAQLPMPEAARSSAGETSAAQVTLLSPKAVTAPDQTAVAPRMREQETAERTDRTQPTDTPTGPPPTFQESPLERQARIALDPPDLALAAPDEVDTAPAPAPADDAATELVVQPAPTPDPPPTPSERAEASFAETRTLSEEREPATVDVSR